MKHTADWVKGGGRVFRPVKHRGECTQDARRGWRLCECPPFPYWHIAYWGPKGEGKWGEIRESSHSDDERKARRLLRERLSAIDSHKAGRAPFIGPKKERATVRDHLAAYVRHSEIRRLASLPQIRNCVHHLNGFCGETRATAVNLDLFNRYVGAKRAEGLEDSTIDRHIESLGAAFSLAVRDGRALTRPQFPKLSKPNANARQGFLSAAECAALLVAVDHDDARDFFAWFRWTGMRPKEIRSLSWACFDRDDWTIRLAHREAKIGVGRALPLAGPWREVVERRIARRRLDCDLIFHFEGRRMPNLAKRWKRACAAAGIEGRVMYDLRRTAARDMLRAGIPWAVVKQITGHKTDAMLTRYNIIDDADLRGAPEKMARYEAGQPAEMPKGADVKEFKA